MSRLPGQERLPLPEFRDYDDRGAIFYAGLDAFQGNLKLHQMDMVAINPRRNLPKLCAAIAIIAPNDSVLSDAKNVQNIFNILALGNELSTIPPITVDNRGNL